MPAISGERLTGLIVGLGMVGVLLTSWLVISELFREPTCPALLGVPACHIVLAAYAVASVAAWRWASRRSEVWFFVGAGLVTVVGVYFTVGELRGTASCPTFEGLPMCYLSLLAGLFMLVLGVARTRTRVGGRSAD